MGDKSQYYKTWYASNKGRWNKTRRSRYQEDEDYREKILSQNRAAKKTKREQAREARKTVPKRSWRTVTAVVDGHEVKMFSIGALARALGKSTQTVRAWERDGLFETRNHSQSGARFYTLEQIESIRNSLIASGKLDPDKSFVSAFQSYEHKVVMAGKKRGKNLKLFKIGVLAQLVGRSVSTLEGLEARGALPETPLRSKHHRLYSLPMMKAVKSAFDNQGGAVRGEESWTEFRNEIDETWKALGVVGAKILE